MATNSKRIHQLNKQMIFNGGKYILYIMRCIRQKSSPALTFSCKRANLLNVPVISAFFYDYQNHNKAQRVFLMEGLIEVKKKMNSSGIPLICLKANNKTAVQIAADLSKWACEVVIDAGYLRHERLFEENLNNVLVDGNRRLTRVEGNVVVPVTLASSLLEFGARTLRPKIWQHVADMLKEKWNDQPIVQCKDLKSVVDVKLDYMDLSVELKEALEQRNSKNKFIGGENEASKTLDDFISKKINGYETKRNIPGTDYQSSLSPYLHYGMINPVDIIRRVNESKVNKASKDAFIEELLVRRELSHNFVYYAMDNYDKLDCLPDWAKKTMNEHLKDKRENLYTYEQLEQAQTHDAYWNAAQLEMVHTNKMHGYLRMYWAKKVIEWTPSYQHALDFLIEQNDKYELDGNDPNGYAGVFWNFGLHDRAHAERKIFGKLRYMNAEGLRRKYKNNIEKFVEINYRLANRQLDEPLPKKSKKS